MGSIHVRPGQRCGDRVQPTVNYSKVDPTFICFRHIAPCSFPFQLEAPDSSFPLFFILAFCGACSSGRLFFRTRFKCAAFLTDANNILSKGSRAGFQTEVAHGCPGIAPPPCPCDHRSRGRNRGAPFVPWTTQTGNPAAALRSSKLSECDTRSQRRGLALVLRQSGSRPRAQ